MLKKIIFISLIILLFSGISVSAQTVDYDYEMLALKEIGVITGDPNGDLRSDDELTRAEFAVMLCRAIGVEELAQSEEMTEKEYFPDVSDDHWAAGYINTAAQYKAINGYEDFNFYPERTVTNEQVVKMLVAAWGYGEEAEQLGGYPNGYMEIAQRYGLLEKVLFNYGNASKRWVACSFTYNAFCMPPAAEIEIPVVKDYEYEYYVEYVEPRPENTKYVFDPVATLKRVTNESAKYERFIFEQLVPEYMLPFEIQGNTLIFNEIMGDRTVRVNVSDPGVKQPLAEDFDLSGLPVGTWKFQLSITDGAVKDTYFCDIIKYADGILKFSENIYRYTALNAQPVLDVVTHEVTLTSSQNWPNPFILTPFIENNGMYALSVQYPQVLRDDNTLMLSMNTHSLPIMQMPIRMENGFETTGTIRGKNEFLGPLTLYNFNLNEDYHLQVSIDNYTEESTMYLPTQILKGDINFFINNNGTLDYVFTGVVRAITLIRFDIRDYEN